MEHLPYEKAKKHVFTGFWILLGVTLLEVVISLAGKGHIIPGLENFNWLFYILALIIIVLSIYKAYYIVFNFMHMGYEVPGLRWSVLLPMGLLVWAIIAFFQEGNAWKNSRQNLKDREMEKSEKSIKPQGSLFGPEIKQLDWHDELS